MWQCGLADFAEDDEPEPVAVSGREARAGLFGVSKKGSESLRVIVDRRRQNCLERRVRDVVRHELRCQGYSRGHVAQRDRQFLLPHASQFCDLFVGADEEVRMYCEDARDFYYLLQWPRHLAVRNVVGPPLDSSGMVQRGARQGLARLAGLSGRARSLLLLAPAMGDQKAVETAQAVRGRVAELRPPAPGGRPVVLRLHR